MKSEDSTKPIVAYEIYSNHTMHLRTAPISRPWMDATHKSFAYRCLPMTIANQAGWSIANPRNFTALWNGDEETIRVGWQKDYFRGKDPGTEKQPVRHQTKLVLREFSRDESLSNGTQDSSISTKVIPISNGCPIASIAKPTDLRKLNWLASYPKSGNTWVRAFLAAYVLVRRYF